jgi:hypothetical protein
LDEDASSGDMPELKEDNQKKLMAFLAEIPPVGGPEIKSGAPALPSPITREKIDAILLCRKPITT